METNKTQTILTALILIVLLGILATFVILFIKLGPTLKELEATMTNVHQITDKIVEIIPKLEQAAGNELNNQVKNINNLLGNIIGNFK